MAPSPSAASSSGPGDRPVVSVQEVTHRYGRVVALDRISLEVPRGIMAGMVGSDGVGKSTLMSLIAGSRKLQRGSLNVLDGDMRLAQHRLAVGPRIAYMPQGLGKNLYLELSVYENVDFMARLFGLSPQEREGRIPQLLEATGLARFRDRPAGKISGGMKQKVSLCGALVHDPDLLILDEPTTGVDPLSRRQFWTLIGDIRSRRSGMSVLISTAYMEEAQQWDWVVAMDAGQVLATGSPAELMSRTSTPDLERCFIALLPEEKRKGHREPVIPPRAGTSEIAIEAHGLTRRFGKFTAVDHVTLSIERGEIFGFLGSNGCGKSTTMKMLTGLLPPTEGTATLFGESVEAGSIEVRERLGYMTQSFSLYGELTVRQNLLLHARLYEIPFQEAQARIDALVKRFGLTACLDAHAEALPLGIRQRLSLAVAVLHEPQILILDEPTSGVDPVARDSFWELLIGLSRRQGVTIFVTTHFMNEGMRCDRISLMNAGRVLACDSPQKLIDLRAASSLEEAFIRYMEDEIPEAADRGPAGAPASQAPQEKKPAPPPAPPRQPAGWGRLLAYARNETQQILRDRIRMTFAFLGSALLMLVFGYGITTDVEHIRYSSLDLDQSPESRQYLEEFAGPRRYFSPRPSARSAGEVLERLQSDEVSLVLEIPPNFGRDLRRGDGPEVLADVDAAMPFRGETIQQYVMGVQAVLLRGVARGLGKTFESSLAKGQATLEERYAYNPTFASIFAMVPSVPTLLLLLIPSILMTVAIVREKELGSMINFYVTPTGRFEYLLGKQMPYVAIGLLNYFIMTVMGLLVFRVPLRGSFLMLTLCTLLYVLATTGIGMIAAVFTRTQVAAIFVTAVVSVVPTVQFSGLLQPVSTLAGSAHVIGTIWPASYYMHSSVGAWTKGLSPSLMMGDILFLGCCVLFTWAISVIGLKKQEQ
jgi:ribosome-dependent ATPase